MPKASVDEDCHLRRAENCIRLASKSLEGLSIAQPSAVQGGKDGPLWGRSRLLLGKHSLSSYLRGGRGSRWERGHVLSRSFRPSSVQNTILGVSARTAIDLFSGAGGTTQGLHDAGYKIIAAVENDATAARTYEANHPGTDLLIRDIRRVQAPAMARRLNFSERPLDLLTACPPCQPFSTLGTGEVADPRNALVSSVARSLLASDPTRSRCDRPGSDARSAGGPGKRGGFCPRGPMSFHPSCAAWGQGEKRRTPPPHRRNLGLLIAE